MKNILENNQLILMEAAVVEQLRRSGNVKLHETLVNAPLIYDEAGNNELKKIYQSYIDIAREAELPFLMCAPTWRANQARIVNSRINRSINSDAVRFMQEIRNSQHFDTSNLKIGGMIGCKYDCYKPDEALSVTESEQFHSWQIEQLARAGVDFLIAETLPNIEEARGIARAMEVTGIPYIISFVISRDGNILDGTELSVAIDIIDAETNQRPLGYMVNCAYPAFLCTERQPASLFNRLIGYQANASALDHCDLDGAKQLEVESISEWGKEMLQLNHSNGVKILGGCCGTSAEHLRYISDKNNQL